MEISEEYPDSEPIHQHLQNVFQNDENNIASEQSSNRADNTERSSPVASVDKRCRRKRRPDIKKFEHIFKKSELPVTCGKAEGTLHKEILVKGISHPCIKGSDGKWFTPLEFEVEGGCGHWKFWKRSIRCEGYPLQKLIEKGYLPRPPQIYCRKEKAGYLPRVRQTYRKKKKRKNLPRLFQQSAESQLSDVTTCTTTHQASRATGQGASNSQHSAILSSSSSLSSLAASPSTTAIVCDGSPRGATPLPSPVSSSRAAPTPPQPQCGSQQPRRKNLPRLFQQSAESQLSDVTTCTTTHQASRATGKGASNSQHSAILSSSSSLSSLAASPSTTAIVCDGSPRGATPLPSPVSSSRAAPTPPQPQCGSQQPRVTLHCLSLATVSGASNNLLEPSHRSLRHDLRTPRQRSHQCAGVMHHAFSSSLGRAILGGQHRMEQVFRKTLGNRSYLKKKLEDIQGHLQGLEKQQAHLLEALNRYNKKSADLPQKMNAIVSHQQVLKSNLLQILTALGIEEPQA